MAEKPARQGGQKERRLRFVGLDDEIETANRHTIRVTLEREAGRKIVSSCPGTASDLGLALAAARATAAALGQALDVGQDAFKVTDLKKVAAFDQPAVIVAISVRSKKKTLRLVGFALMERQQPARAGVLAVLNGTNRYVSAFLAGGAPWESRKG